MWTGTDTRLVVTAVAVVALVIVLITSRLRLHAFPALMTGSLVLGLVAGIPVLILAWVVAVLIRLATGSATVATVTAAGIVAPVLAVEPSVSPVLVALAVGAGSVFFSHVNDAGFWLVRE